MDSGKILCSLTPHEDIEHGYKRDPIPYYIALPESGPNDNTGLIFTISGYGASPEHEYESKLRPYLADKYNCIVIGVDYHSCSLKCPSPDTLRFPDDFFEKLERIYKIKLGDIPPGIDLKVKDVFPVICNALIDGGKFFFDPEMYLFINQRNIYHSFGFLPALDHLQVLAEVLNKYSVNKKRLYILGSSYGGYIGLLIGKLAPKTFRLIIDNSGFVETRAPDVYGVNGKIGSWKDFGDCMIQLTEDSPWKMNPEEDGYLDEHHKQIRSLLVQDHIYPTKTQYYCCHSVKDGLVPVDDKKEFGRIRPESDIRIDIIDEPEVDGKVFKTSEHGMQASLRKVFDIAYSHFSERKEYDAKTDFDLKSEYTFSCSNGYAYVVRFDSDNICVKLLK
ncbi:DUF2920 family protein [Oceanospirillum sediminis]|uniref:DUF2920 family protein n=1 Tax=Oceanospirillum sediminis TaxID=2760088 RepID=A0A839IWC4_9GAMM|nr:DUF2920 family protein [Oceanospirillum sediminis]MBB1489258.1 DUF2920 family protein [Oceanospirillum sediminis]